MKMQGQETHRQSEKSPESFSLLPKALRVLASTRWSEGQMFLEKAQGEGYYL